MFNNHQWQSKTALLLTLVMSAGTAAPLAMSAPAMAAPFRSNSGPLLQPRSQLNLPSGTRIPVYYDKAEKIIVTPEETAPLTLKVADDIKSRSGTILIRAGSDIVGELRPADGGSQFVAKELVMSRGRRLSLNAESEVVTKTETIDKGVNVGNVLKGAAIGAAAATAIAAITGDRAIATEEVLGGAGVGALGGLLLGRKKAKVVVIDPNTDLDLTLNSQLALR